MAKIEDMCPVCKGSGILKPPTKKLAHTKQEMVQTLVKSGYSYREIAELFGWKSPHSVSRLINKKEPDHDE